MQHRLFLWMYMSQTLCKSIITMKEALLRFTVVSFSAQAHFQWECTRHFYDSIKITIFKTQRRHDTTWNFAHSITRVSTHKHVHWEHCFNHIHSQKKPRLHFGRIFTWVSNLDTAGMKVRVLWIHSLQIFQNQKKRQLHYSQSELSVDQ